MQNCKRICALLMMICLVAVLMPAGVFAADDAQSTIVSQQMLLGDDLTMRFYARVQPEHRENGILKIRVGNRTVSYTVADMTPNEDGLYVFSVDLNATEMTENVTVSLETAPVNGPLKFSGVWFVDKGDSTNVQVGDSAAVCLGAAKDDTGCLQATTPAAESGEIGDASTLVTKQSDEAWEGIASQVNTTAAWGITALGDHKSVVIDSPICEGYFTGNGNTYPVLAVNCGWATLNTAAQDVMFYVELPENCGGLRVNSFTCNSWSFWADPAGMHYQYISQNDTCWNDGTVSDDNNKTLALPKGFKGYVRMQVNTIKNAAQITDSALQVQEFTFQCEKFGGATVFRKDYSVRKYAEYILQSNYNAETKDLVKQMLNYGAKAQLHFGNRTHKLANAGYEVESTGTISSVASNILIDGAVDGVSFYGCSILLESKLATRYYFRAPNGVEGCTFLVGDTQVTPEINGDYYYVEEIGITPDRMDDLTVVTVSKNGKDMTVQYSPMCYITRMYNRSNTSQSMKDLLLAAAGYFDAAKVFTGVKVNEYVDYKIALEPLNGAMDAALENNPDRGWRLEAYVNVAATEAPGKAVTGALDFYKDYNPQLCQVYFYLTDYKDTLTIPQDGFDRIQQVFDAAKERGIKLIVRFAYQSDMEGTGEVSDQVMLAHMPQLRPILEKNADVIHTVEAGFLGAWGEWHSYKMEHDELALLKGILDMVPENLYVQVRRPRIKNLLINAEPNNPNLQRIGYHDDSFFGWQTAKWNDGLNPGDSEWEQMRTESFNAPQGGEMFWGCQYTNWDPTSGEEAIRKYSAFHQTSFSLYHSFIEDELVHWVIELHKENPDLGHYSIRDWQTETVTKQMLDSYGVAYDPAWFLDENGQEMERFAFDFVQDHLGYRLQGLDVTLNGVPDCGMDLQISMNLKNTGFSAAFNMESGFAVLDMNGNVLSTVAAGNPADWLSVDPTTGEALIHNVSATLKLPNASGSYQLAFYVQNSAGTGARLANDLPYVNGYTVIQTIILP